ncbi:hypothetical protein F5Y15DRAFT_109626 [Xylariaceae sp. FL0016]|nr:hypothetical protein F5Y15DRAFT_109626 [Xylariaceae sp. FL0016]
MEAREAARPDLAASRKLGLNWSAAERDAYIKGIKVVDLPRLSDPYPMDNYYVAGTPLAKEQWTEYWRGKPLKDPRYNKGRRRDILDLEPDKLRYIVRQDESVIFRDADTQEISLVILRNVVPDDDVRMTMIDLCKEIIKNRRDDRREDPGQLVHFGYTCGSRHAPQIQMAASSLRLDTAKKQENEKKLNVRAQGMAGLVWNMMKSRLPPEIIANYNDLINNHDIPRMDMGRDDEALQFSIGGEDVTFEGLEMPPPSGLSAINYARHTHKETNGNDWILAFTANAPEDPTKGGNFYLASYGIMLEPASNTVSAWHPGDYHGTSLYEMQGGPEKRAGYEVRTDGGFNTGMVFELSRALKNARKNSTWLDERRRAKGGKAVSMKKGRLNKQTRSGLRSRSRARAVTAKVQA